VRRTEIEKFIKTATECSIYVAPTAPGLSDSELVEVGQRLDFHRGEITDTLRRAQFPTAPGCHRWLPQSSAFFADFIFPVDPDFRNIEAFDFVRRHIRDLARSEGERAARVDRAVLVELGVVQGIPGTDVEAAIVVLCLAEHLVDEDGVLRPAPGRAEYPLPSEQRAQATDLDNFTKSDQLRAKVYDVVRDVVQRRTDGRPDSIEPLDAFVEVLGDLGYGSFKTWWRQTLAELRRADPNLAPTSAVVLAAALVEGALTFVVKHARGLGLGVFQSTDFDRPPTQWRIDKLIRSAATGGPTTVLDNATRHRADHLAQARQRIHAGRMISEHPSGPPDLRPEEARDATQTASLVARSILDWLHKHPATGAVRQTS
jgi:hypothetical protein